MADKVIISVAPVAGSEPLLPELLYEDVIKCIDEGASVCHLHCKSREGKLTPDHTNLSQAFQLITSHRDVIVQVSTGGVSEMTIQERCYPLDYPKTESASLNGGSTNLGEAIYKNSMEDIRYCAKACQERGILPEIEVFDIGMIHNIDRIHREMPFQNPLLFNLVFGHQGGMQPTIKELVAFQSFLPENALWGVTHFGRDHWSFLAAAIALGAQVVRIGFEDSRYLEQNRNAQYNFEEVSRLADLVRVMGFEVATVHEAREILHLAPKEGPLS